MKDVTTTCLSRAYHGSPGSNLLVDLIPRSRPYTRKVDTGLPPDKICVSADHPRVAIFIGTLRSRSYRLYVGSYYWFNAFPLRLSSVIICPGFAPSGHFSLKSVPAEVFELMLSLEAGEVVEGGDLDVCVLFALQSIRTTWSHLSRSSERKSLPQCIF